MIPILETPYKRLMSVDANLVDTIFRRIIFDWNELEQHFETDLMVSGIRRTSYSQAFKIYLTMILKFDVVQLIILTNEVHGIDSIACTCGIYMKTVILSKDDNKDLFDEFIALLEDQLQQPILSYI
jgi:hypothetical protein